MENMLTDEHKEMINKRIKKSINEINFTEIMTEYIKDEFSQLWDKGNVAESMEKW